MGTLKITINDQFETMLGNTEEARVAFARQALALACLQGKRMSKEDCCKLLDISPAELDRILIDRELNLSAPSRILADKPTDPIFYYDIPATPQAKRAVGNALIDALNSYFKQSCKGFTSKREIDSLRFRIGKLLFPNKLKIDYQSVLEMREIAMQASEIFLRRGRDDEALIWRQFGEFLTYTPEYFLTKEEIALKKRVSKILGVEEVFDFIADIENGRITIEPIVLPEEIWIGDVTYKASNGWELVIYVRCGGWRHINEIIMDPLCRSSEKKLSYDDIAVSMPDLLDYYPPDEIRWNIYRMRKVVQRTCTQCGFYFYVEGEEEVKLCEDCVKRNEDKK